MNPKILGLLMTVLLSASGAFAYPVVDQAVPVGGEAIAVYHDYNNPDLYWYIPQSIEPWKRDNRYVSSLYDQGGTLSFVFRGQASVDDEVLDNVASALHTSRNNLMPISYESSSNFVCQDFFVDEDHVSWIFPKMIGNYLEVIPVSIRTRNADIIPELRYHLTEGGGLACTVEVTFKAVTTGYKLVVDADFNKVYERFEANVHASGFWWSSDIHTMIEKLRQDHVITIRSLEDTSLPQTELDKKIQIASDEILKGITTAMFTPALKLPSGPVGGRGLGYNLNADYEKSEEHARAHFELDSDKVQTKNSQISLRLSTK